MAKNRRVVTTQRPPNENGVAASQSNGSPLFSRLTGIRLATAMMGAIVVYVAYWTHDSIEVPQGAARYLVMLAIIGSAVAVFSFEKVRPIDVLVDSTAWAVAGWMALSLMVNSGHANVRLGINELGWWIATAAIISCSRRVASLPSCASRLLRLMMAVALGVAIYGWHQLLFGFPEMIHQYEQNPEAMLRQLGIESEGNSAMRIVFENRLRDGGPTGTFALANSMAAMLVGGFVAMVGWLVMVYRRETRVRIATLMFGIVVVGAMILATRSRTAVVSLFCLGAYAILVNMKTSGWAKLNLIPRRNGLIAAAATFVVLLSAVAYRFRDSEWIQQAPASVLFRLRYWVACWRMFLESPWFGVGPGQFKSAYESFRVEEALEQIADPHQFALQTLVAGGLPAMIMLLASIGLMLRMYQDRNNTATTQQEHVDDANSVLLGIGASLIGVWLVGAMVGQLPTVEPAILGTISTIAFYWILSHGSRVFDQQSDWPATKKVAGCAALAIGIDLLASGGITVPGISVVAWTFLAIAGPVSFQLKMPGREPATNQQSGMDGLRVGGALFLIVIAVVWYAVGILPVEQSKQHQNRFLRAWSSGQVDDATRALEQATKADRWDVTPSLSLVNVYRTLSTSDSTRRADWLSKWDAAETEAATRASCDAVVMRQLGDQRLLDYQSSADRKMLETAAVWYARAAELAPSHEAYAAQLAEVLRELGDPRATEIAFRAQRLSQAGGYYERLLDFTMIYEAKPLEALTTRSSGLVIAKTALAEFLSKPNESK